MDERTKARQLQLACGCLVTLVCQSCCDLPRCCDPVKHMRVSWEQRAFRANRCLAHESYLPLKYVPVTDLR
jgi:hypothetical protein